MYRLLIIGLGLLLTACGDTPEDSTPQHQPIVERNFNAMQLARGERIFSQNCAECHGEQAQGDPKWQFRDASGRFPPPPLNGTAHAWHHPMAQLKHVIANGSPGGKGNMPAWRGKLSEQEIEDVIIWFQSLWPDEVYTAWYGLNQRALQR